MRSRSSSNRKTILDDLARLVFIGTGGEVGNELTPEERATLPNAVQVEVIDREEISMNQYLLTMAVSIVLQMVKESFKNPTSKAKLKAVLFKVWTQIGLLYAGDPDFSTSAITAAKAKRKK